MGTLIAVTVAGFVVGGLILTLATRRACRQERRTRAIKFLVYAVIVALMLLAAWLGVPWLAGLMAVILATGSVEIARAKRRASATQMLTSRIWVAYGGLSLVCLAGILAMPPILAAFMYLVVASFDGFSQAVGQLLGRRKLAPAISPNKTVEGLVGGLAGASTVAAALAGLVGLSLGRALFASCCICLSGLAGDLSASWLKRRAGIKDYGQYLPGHGGFLDRFDSFIAASAACGLWIGRLAG